MHLSILEDNYLLLDKGRFFLPHLRIILRGINHYPIHEWFPCIFSLCFHMRINEFNRNWLSQYFTSKIILSFKSTFQFQLLPNTFYPSSNWFWLFETILACFNLKLLHFLAFSSICWTKVVIWILALPLISNSRITSSCPSLLSFQP